MFKSAQKQTLSELLTIAQSIFKNAPEVSQFALGECLQQEEPVFINILRG